MHKPHHAHRSRKKSFLTHCVEGEISNGPISCVGTIHCRWSSSLRPHSQFTEFHSTRKCKNEACRVMLSVASHRKPTLEQLDKYNRPLPFSGICLQCYPNDFMQRLRLSYDIFHYSALGLNRVDAIRARQPFVKTMTDVIVKYCVVSTKTKRCLTNCRASSSLPAFL